MSASRLRARRRRLIAAGSDRKAATTRATTWRLLKGFRKLPAFGDAAKRLAQDNQLIVSEKLLELFVSGCPIASSADHFILAGFRQPDGPTAPVALVMTEVDETVAFKRSKCLAKRGSLHDQDLGQFTNGWRIGGS